ncbi:hypothetical protein [Aquimarina sp. MMG016]|uniref:hypothetical protein n=1 Tax=Aquimarina sp. MMG016 TaxID=2822690 RepID=UPI001B39D497|nr:hypothetical protein [Aquimarina sp. MMG016]MBQ4820738.1 hypothetical protein [Aquimarina sp. MMG016]
MKKTLLILASILLIISCKDDQKSKDAENKTSDKNEVVSDTETSSTPQKTSSPTNASKTLDLEQEVQNFITCKKAATERNDCRNSITKIISEGFDLTEFNDPKLGYVVYDSIRPIAESSRNWIQLGTINQETIDQALEHTNRGGLALIIDTSETYGHVVMIVPGESKKSGSWGMKLPNVLSLTNYKPEKSFSDKSLSYAMKKSDDLKIFLRQ